MSTGPFSPSLPSPIVDVSGSVMGVVGRLSDGGMEESWEDRRVTGSVVTWVPAVKREISTNGVEMCHRASMSGDNRHCVEEGRMEER